MQNKIEEYEVRWTEDHKQIVTASSQEEATKLVENMQDDLVKQCTVLRHRGYSAEKAWKDVHPDRVYEIRLAYYPLPPISTKQTEVMASIHKLINDSNILGHGIEMTWVNSEESR